MSSVKHFPLRIVFLVLLIAFFGLSVTKQGTASACEQCVFPTGGICVGCQEQDRGFNACTPDQSSCSCVVSGGSCRVGGILP